MTAISLFNKLMIVTSHENFENYSIIRNFALCDVTHIDVDVCGVTNRKPIAKLAF